MVNILIMDDEPGLRNVVHNMLKPLGHPLFLAEDGKEAVNHGRNQHIDIAMLDMRVPDMDGLEVMVELKKINPNIRCIMLSGFGDVETAVSTLKQGAFDYISKPFKVDEVIKVVNKAINSLGGTSGPAVAAPVAAQVGQKPKDSKPAAEPKQKKQGMKPKIPLIPIISAIAGILVVGLILKLFILKGASGAKDFAIPYSNATGMCWIEPNLWVSDWVTGNIYQHNLDSKFSINSVYKTVNAQPTGITFDGEHLWSCNAVERRIYKHRLDSSLSVVAIYALEDVIPSALYFDGAHLWVIDTDNAKIYKHKMGEELRVLASFDSPALNPCGMFRSGEFFFIGDYKTSRLYKVSLVDFAVREVFDLPGYEVGKYKLSGVGWDGKSLWASSEEVGLLFQIDMKAIKPIKF